MWGARHWIIWIDLQDVCVYIHLPPQYWHYNGCFSMHIMKQGVCVSEHKTGVHIKDTCFINMYRRPCKQVWCKTLIVFFPAFLKFLSGATQTRGSECGWGPEGPCVLSSVFCCLYRVESALTASPVISEQTLRELCRRVLFCRLVERNQQVMANVKCQRFILVTLLPLDIAVKPPQLITHTYILQANYAI